MNDWRVFNLLGNRYDCIRLDQKANERNQRLLLRLSSVRDACKIVSKAAQSQMLKNKNKLRLFAEEITKEKAVLKKLWQLKILISERH